MSYRKDDARGLYYVEKTSLRRLGDYTIRMCASPVTVCLDVVPVITCIGTILWLQGYGAHPNEGIYSWCFATVR